MTRFKTLAVLGGLAVGAGCATTTLSSLPVTHPASAKSKAAPYAPPPNVLTANPLDTVVESEPMDHGDMDHGDMDHSEKDKKKKGGDHEHH